MVIRQNQVSYGLPLSLFVAGILVGTAIGILRADNLAKMIVCYLPMLHIEAQRVQFGLGFGQYVCRLRLPVFGVMAVSVFTGFSAVIFTGVSFAAGASAAIVILSATMLGGMTGILQALALFLPHSLFYLFGYWALYELAGKRMLFRTSEQIQIAVKIGVIWLAGMLTETLISPFAVTWVLRL